MAQQRKIYLVFSQDSETNLDSLLQNKLLTDYRIDLSPVKLEEFDAIYCDEQLNQVLIWVKAKDYPEVLKIALQKKMQVGFLPVKGDVPSQFVKSLGLPDSLDDCLELVLSGESFQLDLIQCNDEIVTDGVNLENQTTMAEFLGDSQQISGFRKIQFQFKRFIHAFSLRPHPVTLITGKEKVIPTAITGMVLLDFHKQGPLYKLFEETISLADHRISVVLFAPQSILSYLQLSSSVYLSTQKKQSLRQMGYIRTESLTIQSPEETHYLVNKKTVTTTELTLQVLPEPLSVFVGDEFKARQQFRDDKENVICDQLPQQEERIKYLSKTLPFFSHALESDFKDLFLNLKEGAASSTTFTLLMVLSSLLASLGLFLNSPSVVIGAMVLAPLMAPIIALSMGLLRSNAELSRQSFGTVFSGVFIALALSALMAWIIPFREVTNEISGRLHPSMLDLVVAVLSGIAGALANARENIAKSLPGVAIAVALVPPLCVAGIGMGWWQMEIMYGAMLLFLTNLTGIILAAGLTFMVMGFAPFSRARKGIFVSIILVIIISVPLFASFQNMQKTASIKKQLISRSYQIDGQKFRLRNVKIRLGSPLKINADLLSTRLPDSHFLKQVEASLGQQLKQTVTVDLSVHLVTHLD